MWRGMKLLSEIRVRILVFKLLSQVLKIFWEGRGF